MRRGGFTLVEIVIAAAVGALVAAAAMVGLHAVFSGWARLAVGGGLGEAHRALLRLERDVAAAKPLPGVPFEGAADLLRFPLERGGGLVVVEWETAPGRLARAERTYLFDGEERFDGRDADGRPVPVRRERFRVPGEKTVFAFSGDEPAGEGREGDALSSDWAAVAPTNLPRRVRVTMPGVAVRDLPCRLGAPPEPSR